MRQRLLFVALIHLGPSGIVDKYLLCVSSNDSAAFMWNLFSYFQNQGCVLTLMTAYGRYLYLKNLLKMKISFIEFLNHDLHIRKDSDYKKTKVIDCLWLPVMLAFFPCYFTWGPSLWVEGVGLMKKWFKVFAFSYIGTFDWTSLLLHHLKL